MKSSCAIQRGGSGVSQSGRCLAGRVVWHDDWWNERQANNPAFLPAPHPPLTGSDLARDLGFRRLSNTRLRHDRNLMPCRLVVSRGRPHDVARGPDSCRGRQILVSSSKRGDPGARITGGLPCPGPARTVRR